jgi:predicted amidohydrolase YtcJ
MNTTTTVQTTLLLMMAACATQPATAPVPSTVVDAPIAAPEAEPARTVVDADNLDARTRPEPHPVIPLGQQLTAYVGPRFLTGEEFVPEARVIIADETGRVRALLQSRPASLPYPVVELPGALAVAGLHDAHVHIEGIGEQAEQIDLVGVKSIGELRSRIANFAKKHRDVPVLVGRGWDQSLWPSARFPTLADLVGVSPKPMWLERVDGHAGLANDALLKRIGITNDTTNPTGGRIERDSKGVATGMLIDAAMALVQPALPVPTDDDHKRRLTAGLLACARAGLVAVHDMGMSPTTFQQLRALDAAGAVPLRVFVYLDGTDDASYSLLGTVAATERVRLMGVKLYVDGALGSRGAALHADYSDAPGQRGLLVSTEAALLARVQQAHRSGHQAALHAIGDAANHLALDVLTKAHDDRVRDRVEHAQLLSDIDVPRFVAMQITASMQPTHATTDMRWAEARVGQQRLSGAYAWRSLWDSGAALALGSDAPVENIRPAWGIHAAITRQDHDGKPPAGFLANQRLSQPEALQGFARMAAYAVNQERHMGALTPGMAMDLTFFESDAAAATDAGDPRAWLRTQPVATMVQGRLQLIPHTGLPRAPK